MPALTDESRWPYAVVGIGFAVLGVVFVGFGFRRMREVDRAIERGEYARPDERLMAFLAAAGVVLGVALILIVSLDA